MKTALHLTLDCNLRCTYCYVGEKHGVRMSRETAREAVHFAFQQSRRHTDLTFFGGEPLLEKELLLETVDYARTLHHKMYPEKSLRFFTTTNGVLLDEAFLTAARERGIRLTLSLDGYREGHDLARKRPDGSGSFSLIEENFRAIFTHTPEIELLMTFTPANIGFLAAGIENLYAAGFRVFNLGPNYEEPWPEPALTILKDQFARIGDFYLRCFRGNRHIFVSTIDGKIATRTHPRGNLCSCCDKEDGEIAIAPSGNIYPCLRFVKTDQDHTLLLGNIKTGLDLRKRAGILAAAGREWEDCRKCGYRGRCFHYCSAINFRITGDFSHPPPVLCRLEQLTIEAADRLAETLYQEKNPQFLRRFYGAR
jgi:uncharacterized protein